MKRFTSFIAILLSALLLLGLTPAFSFADAADNEIRLLACSDFQHPDGNTAGTASVNAILTAMKQDGITSADGLLACGDYDYEYTDTKAGIAYLKLALKNFVNGQQVFVQGNHDSQNSAAGTNGLSNSGNNDPAHEKYGVFVIHEEDYMWYNDDEGKIKRTAQNLIEYLNEKLASGYDKPIFILSHLGLHYSMRTANEGFAMHARYLFDAINEAGEKGLNIFFLFGHDHSNGWDDYLGGASIYLAKGDTMLVADGSKTAKTERTLAFTYLNAGYIGYYNNVNGQDDALTMTYITVKDNEVTLARYDKNGKHDLKAKGVSNTYKNETGYAPDETVYTSPQTVSLTAISDKTPIDDLLHIDKTQPAWKKLAGLSELESGKSYLMFYNGSPNSVMLPKEVTKANSGGSERIGFDLLATESFGDEIAYAQVENALWTFEKMADGWLIKSGEKSIAYENTSNQGIAAYLSDTLTPLTLAEEGGGITVKCGDYYLNYNSRGLINFYASNPATFSIYEAVGYGITVNGGTVTKDGATVSFATAGDTLSVTAQDAPSGYAFEKWEVTGGTITLDDPTQATQTFVMPDGALTLKAQYQAVVSSDTPTSSDTPATSDTPTTDDTPVTGDGNTPPSDEPSEFPTVLVIVIAVVLLGGGAVAVLVWKKKKR